MAKAPARTTANIRWAKRSLTALCVLTGLSACVQIAGIEEPTLGDPNGSAGASGSGGQGGGSASSGGAGGAGGGMVCTTGSKEPCYSGPGNTPNIGTCKPGTQTCLADGTGYGACFGEVMPVLENCVAAGDEDCDGFLDLEDSECKCTTPRFKTSCDTGLLGVCATGTGICAEDGRSIDSCVQNNLPSPENCATPDDDDCDGMAHVACSGDPKWTYAPVGGSAIPNDDAIFSVAATPDGGYVIAGVVDGTIGADGYGVTAGKAYVAKLDANKTVIWEKKYAAASNAVARGVAVDKDGNVIVVGTFFGDTMLTGMNTVSNTIDGFMVKLNPAGTALWSRVFVTTKDQNIFGVSVDDNANIYITGSTEDPLDFGSGAASMQPSSHDVFVASYTPTNTYRWSKLYVNAGAQLGRAITTTANGDVVIIGDTSDDTNLGGGTIPKGGNLDIFVTRYSGADGNHQWSKLFGKAFDQVGRDVAMSPDGNVLITGGFEGTIDWKSGTTMSAIGTSDVYVAKLDGLTGNYLAHAQGGKGGTSVGTSIGADAAGNVTVFGHFNGAIDFGGQQVIASTSTYDTFLVKLQSADWKPVWTRQYGNVGNQYGWGAAVSGDGSALVGGGFYTELEVPPMQSIPSTGGSDLFAARVSP